MLIRRRRLQTLKQSDGLRGAVYMFALGKKPLQMKGIPCAAVCGNISLFRNLRQTSTTASLMRIIRRCNTKWTILILLASIMTTGCFEKEGDESMEAIGQAFMLEDGTIILTLSAREENGTRGDARLVYPKGHKEYNRILSHLGGIEAGQTKPVPPWQ